MTTSPRDGLPTVLLHIGTPKSGTTYLQSRLEVNRDEVSAQGLMWPGPRWGTQVEAVRELRTLEEGGTLDPGGPWMSLVARAHAWPGPRVLISMEWLAGCTQAQVEAAVTSLQPAPVEVVCTTRDLLRMFVAQWQEMTKNCRPWSWRQFVDEVVGEQPGPASQRFWNQQDVPVILQKWAEFVPWDHFHLVTVPPQGSDPEILWDRFCSVVGLTGTAFEQPPRTNESIGVVSAMLMHRVNLVALERDVDRLAYQRVLHRGLADGVLAPRRGLEAPITVSPETDEWIRRRAQRQVDEIRQLDLHVVGDLDELLPGPPLSGREPDAVSETELLETCVEALVTFALEQDAVNKQLQRENRRLRRRAGRPKAPRTTAQRAAARRSAAIPPKGKSTSKAASAAKQPPGRQAAPAAEGLGRRAGRLVRRGRSGIARVVRRHADEP